VSSINQSILF